MSLAHLVMPQAIRVLQITDLHLKADTSALWRGHNVQNSLDSVLELARRNTHWPPELILVTGDIVDDETPEGYRLTYQRFTQQLRDQLGKAAETTQIACIPGNHDEPTILTDSCKTLGIEGCGSFELDNWQIIQLDSTLPGNCDGELGKQQLKLLQTALNSSRHQQNILISLHHPLIELDSQWMDEMRVKDADAFFNIVTEFNAHSSLSGRAIKAVVWGHAHQQTDEKKNGVCLLGTPAAGPVQFTVGSDDFAIDESLSPGLRWITLHENGEIDTYVERVK